MWPEADAASPETASEPKPQAADFKIARRDMGWRIADWGFRIEAMGMRILELGFRISPRDDLLFRVLVAPGGLYRCDGHCG